MLHAAPTVSFSPEQESAWLGLLEHFYSRHGLPLPRLERVKGLQVPQPYRKLLVHSSDMTPTLEGFYGQRLGLRVLSRRRFEDSYYREVTLFLEPDLRPVEYGVIRIYLEHLPAPARQRVLGEQTPLGTILHREGVPHLGWPQSFFRTETDPNTCKALCVVGERELYGRRNVLLDGSRRLIADVIEILAPVPAAIESE